jgi:AcrR family transcriptional regulator
VRIPPPEEPTLPKIVDHEARRAEVAAAAQRTIARLGIHNTRLRDIAEEAKCSTGVLTHYFPDKDALIRFSLEDSLARFEERLQRTVQAGAGALRATLEQVLPLDKERRTQWTVWLAFWGQAVGSKSLSAEQRRHYRDFRSLLEQLVVDGMESGSLHADLDPTDEADRLLALVEGISFQAVFDPQRWPRDRQLSMVDDHLARLSTGARGGARRLRSVRPGS